MLRRQARIRINDFAQTAGVSKQFISDLERGKSTVQMGGAMTILVRWPSPSCQGRSENDWMMARARHLQ